MKLNYQIIEFIRVYYYHYLVDKVIERTALPARMEN